MHKIKAILIFLAIWAILGGMLVMAQEINPPSGRYFIFSQNGFLKKILGVEHAFDKGFTTNLTAFQISIIKSFGIKIQEVDYYKISNLDEQPQKEPQVSQIINETLKRKNLPKDQISWAIKEIYNDPELTETIGGKNVNVAILDTGVFKNHPDLISQIKDCKDFTKGDTIKNSCEDKNGHGTHLAGIVAAGAGFDKKGIFGMAPQANLHIYKICESTGYCLADDVASAINFATNLPKENQINIILLGFGGEKDSFLVSQALKLAVDKNILIIAPAGNNGPQVNSVDYPASLKEVLSVGYLNQKLEVAKESSRGKNPGLINYLKEEGEVEVVAPGVNIESTWMDGGYKILSGSSQAAALIAGLAAKLWEQNNYSALKTRNAIDNLATLNDLPPQGDDARSGFGFPKLQYSTNIEKPDQESSPNQNL